MLVRRRTDGLMSPREGPSTERAPTRWRRNQETPDLPVQLICLAFASVRVTAEFHQHTALRLQLARVLGALAASDTSLRVLQQRDAGTKLKPRKIVNFCR